MRAIADEAVSSDEELMRSAASGSAEAVAALYARYAPRLLAMAVQALDRGTAEEVVQDVFVSVWKNARSFDPKRGPVRPWLFQIAHHRIANELRRRRRRPQIEDDSEGERLASLADPGADPSRETWETYRREALGRALEKLPPPQRQALGLAYFQELSHEQIASVLSLPLGTAKSRVRAGLRNLRVLLASVAVVLAAVALWVGLDASRRGRQRLAQDDRALTMLTASDAQALRLTASEGVSSATHAVFRFRPGGGIAVLTFSNFGPPPSGKTYQAWALSGGRWISIGTAVPDRSGRARLVAEGPEFNARPDALRVTLEPAGGGPAPAGPDVVRWSPP